MHGVMTVGIEPQTMLEARLRREVLFGHALQVVDKPVQPLWVVDNSFSPPRLTILLDPAYSSF